MSRRRREATPPEATRTADFAVENHGSIFLLWPLTADAAEWVDAHLPDDRQEFFGAVVVGHRYISDIVRGAQADGLEVE